MKKFLFVICLIAAGTFSYIGGYRVYKATHPKTEIPEVTILQKSTPVQEEYYIGKIEQDMLIIYKMPEEMIYDSVEVSSLNFYGTEEAEFTAGKVFANLTEVFEFLENSMS